MFTQTENTKYTTELHDDIGKIIPKFARHYKALGKFCTETVLDEAIVFALAMHLVADYEAYSNMADFVRSSMAPRRKQSKKTT